MSDVQVNRRRAVRRAFFVDCQVVRERDFKLVGDHALDLSVDGMMVESRLPVLTGDKVILTFREPRSGRWFDAEATVARVAHGRRDGDMGRCVGLSFDRLDDEARTALNLALMGRPPRLPLGGRSRQRAAA